jgi:hypothetical protein
MPPHLVLQLDCAVIQGRLMCCESLCLRSTHLWIRTCRYAAVYTHPYYAPVDMQLWIRNYNTHLWIHTCELVMVLLLRIDY